MQESDNDFDDSDSEDDVPLSVPFSRNRSLRIPRANTPKKQSQNGQIRT
jgi:hypothetical protein